jgi:2-isopropylmalate synthase
MLKNEETYEIMRPDTVGAGKSRLVLGRQSGRHAFRARLAELGYSLDDASLVSVFERFKEMAAGKRHIEDDDLVVLMNDGAPAQAAL